VAAYDGATAPDSDESAREAPLAARPAFRPPPDEKTSPEKSRTRARDILVLVIGLLTALNLIQYKYFESTWNRHFAVYNAVFLAFLTIFVAGGLLIFLFGARRLFGHRPRKLTLLVAGIILASASLGGLLALRQGGVPGLSLGLLALLSLALIIAGQFEVGLRDGAGIFLAITGMALVTLVPVHEAFLVLPLGDLWAAPNLGLMVLGAALAAAGILLVQGYGEPGGRPTAAYGLWLTGVMALFLVPFHEAAGINSNQAYGALDQTLIATGALAILAGVIIFLRRRWHELEFERHLREGDRRYARGDLGGALERYELALAINPEYGDAWVHKGAAEERLGRLEASQKSLERALELAPDDHVALATLASVHRRAGNPGKALRLTERATELAPDYEVGWTNRANALADLRRLDEALEAFERAVTINPGYEKAWYNKGVVLLARGRNEEALECFNEVLDITPNDERALRMREDCYRALGASPAEG